LNQPVETKITLSESRQHELRRNGYW